MATEGITAGSSEQELDPRRWIALGVVLTGMFMVLLDVSIVVVAIPSIQVDLTASFAQIQLVLALYQVAYAVMLITGGRLGDIAGRKRLFMIGMSGFVVASALCGLAPSPEILIAARVLQGFMAALMYPQVLSVIQVLFPPRERATAFAIFGAVLGLATISGPLLGGLLIQANLFGSGWRPIFLVNVPVGVSSLIAAYFLLRKSRAPQALKLDLLGVAIVSAALLLLIWPLVEGREAGWPAWAFISLVASLPVFVVFALFERYESQRSGSPLVEPRLFKDRAFVVGLLITMLFIAGIPAFFFTFSLYLQIGLGYTPLHSGLTTLPFSLGSFIASAASARAAARLGRNVLFIGCAVLVAGMLLLILSIHLAGIGVTSLELTPALFVCGIGLGTVIAPLLNVLLAGIQPSHAGSASGVLTTIQQIGGAVGVAIIGVIFFGLLSSNSGHIGRELAPDLRQKLVVARVPAQEAPRLVQGFQQCFHDRSTESDPTVVPPSCKQTQPGTAAGLAFRSIADTARKRDFSDSFVVSILFCVGTFAMTGLLVAFLPRRASSASLGHEAAAV